MLRYFGGHKEAKVVMGAQMTGNQSGAEKDNRLLSREQWMLLFSKSKMAEAISANKAGVNKAGAE